VVDAFDVVSNALDRQHRSLFVVARRGLDYDTFTAVGELLRVGS
jgi:hypothetical protein